MRASYAGQNLGIDIDKKQEKNIIYIVVGIIVIVIAYMIYKGVQAVETVSNPILKGTEDIGNALNTITGGVAGTVKYAVDIPAMVYDSQKDAYNTGAASIEQTLGMPTGSYNTYLESMGILATPLKIASAITPDILETLAAQAGQTVRTWYDFVF